MEKRKIRFSILARVALMFLAAALVSAALSLAISYRFILDFAARQGRDIAVVAGLAVRTAIGSKNGFYRLYHDELYRKDLHRDFKYICESASVQNLYLYTIDENEEKSYIVLASADDETDRLMNEQYGFGTDHHRPLYDTERNIILNGNTDGDYEIVDNSYGKVFMYVLPIVSAGKTLAYIGVDFSFDNIVSLARSDVRVGFLYGMLILLLTFIISVVLIKRLIIIPIRKLSAEMGNFAKDKHLSHEARQDESMFEDEITDIKSSFIEMADDISKYVRDIEVLTRERVQTQTQLEVARNIQCGIVPEEYTLSGEGFNVFGFEKPAWEVGGDFYDAFKIDDDNICVAIGDISGKGIYAALFMVLVRTALREKMRAGAGLADALMEANHDICLANPENMFATIFLLSLDVKTGIMRYANAGHNPPILLSEKTSFLKMESGMALGLFYDAVIEENSIQLSDGDGILIYTDGITEATDKDNSLYGEERLLKEVSSCYDSESELIGARELVDSVVASVKRHCGDSEQFDDMTCAALIYRKEGEGKQTLTPDIAAFRHVKEAILRSLGESEYTRTVILACEEIFANIVAYSGADNVYFTSKRSGDTYSVSFSDNGVPFDPVMAKVQDKEFEELDNGGMGIMLARMYSREMNYNRIDDRNYLVLKFNTKEEV